jgi:hypothetical protein
MHIEVGLNAREPVVVAGGGKEGGPNSEKGHIEGPDIFQGCLDGKNFLGTNQGSVGKGTTLRGKIKNRE